MKNKPFFLKETIFTINNFLSNEIITIISRVFYLMSCPNIKKSETLSRPNLLTLVGVVVRVVIS